MSVQRCSGDTYPQKCFLEILLSIYFAAAINKTSGESQMQFIFEKKRITLSLFLIYKPILMRRNFLFFLLLYVLLLQ
jgi:hypothetical protein